MGAARSCSGENPTASRRRGFGRAPAWRLDYETLDAVEYFSSGRQIMRRLLIGVAIAAFGLSALCVRDSLAVIIDDFEVGPVTVARTDDQVAYAAQTGLDPAHVIGGARSITVGDNGAATQTLVIDPDAGSMSFEVGSDTHGYFGIVYGSEASPLELDLLADGARALALDVEPGANRVIVRVYSANGSRSFSQNDGATFSLPDGRTRTVFAFDALLPDVDLSNVERISISGGRVFPGSSLTVHRLATVPEPSVLLLAVIAGVTVIAGGRCGRKARVDDA